MGIPYYDWTIEAGRESDPWILNTVFGGEAIRISITASRP